jgi:elongation factor 1-gamma
MSKLLISEANPVTWKILVSAKLANYAITVEKADIKTPAFLQQSPTGKAPVLQTAQGNIFEPNAATKYVAKNSTRGLLGSNDFETALVDQWIEFAAAEIDLPASVWVFPLLGYINNNPTATQRAKGDIRKVLEILNAYLHTRTFLVGERLTVADVVVASSLYRLYERVLDPAFRKQFVNANRWFTTIVNQPEYIQVAGQITLSTKMEVASKESENQVAQVSEKAEPKKEVKAPKAEKPKEEKPKPAAEDDGEDLATEEPKKKSKLDFLPPSKFILDEWKRTYSNEDTRGTAIPWFWNNLDKEGYSIWFSDYKYNEELEKTFMTANLISGFLQRLDKLRKYAFGSLIIFGEEPKLSVSGVWVFRGKEIPEEMLECDDAEHYNWTQANLEDNATKELINDYFAWDGSFGGKTQPFNQGKVFK